jgi:cobalamin biosynthesis protein CobD/CbiB
VKRTVPYFYDNVVNLIKKEIAPESTQSSSFWGIAVFIILVVVVTVVTISISLCKYKQSGLFKPKQTIAFELSPLNTKNSSSRPE